MYRLPCFSSYSRLTLGPFAHDLSCWDPRPRWCRMGDPLYEQEPFPMPLKDFALVTTTLASVE